MNAIPHMGRAWQAPATCAKHSTRRGAPAASSAHAFLCIGLRHCTLKYGAKLMHAFCILQFLALHNNQLSGPLPTWGTSIDLWAIVLPGNSGLCGSVSHVEDARLVLLERRAGLESKELNCNLLDVQVPTAPLYMSKDEYFKFTPISNLPYCSESVSSGVVFVEPSSCRRGPGFSIGHPPPDCAWDVQIVHGTSEG